MTAVPKLIPHDWRLAFRVVPFVLLAALVKLGLDEQGWEPIGLSPLYTGLLAATIFLLGFLLAGVLADYKESEKLPGELTASLETIADECEILYQDKKAAPALDCLHYLREVAASVLGWLYSSEPSSPPLERIAGLNGFFLAFEPLTQPNFIVRLKQEQSALRRMLIRIDTIRNTSFVGAGYTIAQMAAALIVIGLLFVDINPGHDAIFILCIITFLLVYIIVLIKDLDDPYQYNANRSEAGAAEVSLKPIEELEHRLSQRIAALEGTERVEREHSRD
jgi:branched-subunit amino acid transport protein AzlD